MKASIVSTKRTRGTTGIIAVTKITEEIPRRAWIKAMAITTVATTVVIAAIVTTTTTTAITVTKAETVNHVRSKKGITTEKLRRI